MADDKETLPTKARAKIFALFDQQQQLATLMHSTQRQITELNHSTNTAPLSEHAVINKEVARLQALRERHTERHRAFADLNSKVRRFLDMLPADAVIEDAKVVKVKLKGETHQQAVATLRGQVMQLIAERSQVERAALPVDEVKAQAKKWITERAMKGRPAITANYETFEVKFFARGWTHTPTPDVLSLLAWYDPEYLEGKLNALIDERPQQKFTLTPSEKAERLAAIKVELGDAERLECAIIDDALDDGIIIDHRPNVDIRALLGIVLQRSKRQKPRD